MSSGRRFGLPLLLCLLWLGACELERGRITIPVFGQLEVRSDPSGALIVIDGTSTGLVTPARVDRSAARHRLKLQFTSALGEVFEWEDDVVVPETALAVVDAALVGGCRSNCAPRLQTGRVACVITGRGDFCSTVFNPNRPGDSAWPATSVNEYVAGLRLQVGAVIAPDAVAFAGDTVASLVYADTWRGRSPVSVTSGAAGQVAAFRYWSDPGPTLIRLPLRGIEVGQWVIAPSLPDLVDVLYFRFRLLNVTADPRFRAWRPEVPEPGLRYEGLYAGMSLDADIGDGDDDVGTTIPDAGVAFLYDLNFRDSTLVSGYPNRPPLVGLVITEAPASAVRRAVSLWRIGEDWERGPGTADDDLDLGYRLLTARLQGSDPFIDCSGPGDDVGACSDDPADYRISLAAGPVTLAPGDSAVFALALVFAEPVPGTFVSGSALPPGNPRVPGRSIEAVADSLVARAQRARSLWPQVWTQVGP